MTLGYLDRNYLEDAYGSGINDPQGGFQIRQLILDKTDQKGMQTEQVIKDDLTAGMQAEMIIKKAFLSGMQVESAIKNVLKTAGMQVDQALKRQPSTGMQALMSYAGQSASWGVQAEQFIKASPASGMQASMDVTKPYGKGMQALMHVIDSMLPKGMQINMVGHNIFEGGFQIDMVFEDLPVMGGMQAKHDTLRHALCDDAGSYLTGGYLEDDYFSYCMRAFLGMQVNRFVIETFENGMQVNQQIVDREKTTGMQTEQHIAVSDPSGMQALTISVYRDGMQATMVIYNNTQLRVMYDFPSRGTPAQAGINWTMNPPAATGDFSPNNLNTDIIEQVTRSVTAGSIELICDTGLPQGVPVDTIAILGHNLTRSATVQVQGAKNAAFAPSDIVFTMQVTLENMYWVAETLPTLLGQNRYWKFTVQDPTNTDGYIEIGSIVFGVSNIFSLSECFTNPIEHGWKHFKDEVEIEGYTNIMNDRALKRWVKLKFEDLDYQKGNYSLLRDMMQYVRTNLKALVIPTPLYPDRYAVFAKLVDMPNLSNRTISEDADYTSFDLEWDESK